MIFALADYLQYRFRVGRFGDHQRDGVFGSLAFLDEIPDDVMAQIEPADIIFTQRLDSALSWAVMYFGSSPVDHSGICTGEGTVVHVTLGSVREHSLRVIAKGARVLIVKDMASVVGDMLRPSTGGVLTPRSRWFHPLPPKAQMAVAAVEIMLGFYPASFRWWFFADILFLCSVIDAALYSVWHLSLALPIAALLGSIVAFNIGSYAYQKWKKKPFQLLSHPDLGLRSFYRNGGRMVTKLGTLVICDFGILPLKLFLAMREQLGLSGEGADDGTDDDLQELGQITGNRVEDRDPEGVSGGSENQNGDEGDNEKVEKSPDHPR